MAFDPEARKTERETQAVSGPAFAINRDATETTLSVSLGTPNTALSTEYDKESTPTGSWEDRGRERERKVQYTV